ncbi:ATP-binding protein [Actinomadura madurae]|uniref:ATP-binding protein n=1 Tax=Actinomadura madurae TaxID=1993 RepID=UPI002026638F|nr:ATP-binding protein [Actinomadura madurae]URN05016.1 ATP-binding protein [Actinomadura madurae]
MSPTVLPAVPLAPLRWRRSFTGGLEQARNVGRFVGCLLDGCPFLDDVLLAADELVVNALRHVRHEVAHFEWLRRLEVGMVT